MTASLPGGQTEALETLIARLEQAECGSGELSWAIAEALGWTKYWSMVTVYLPPGEVEGSYEGRTEPPHYTTSIDAALTLVPAGWRFARLEVDRKNNTFSAEIESKDGMESWYGNHRDKCIAVVIGCLCAASPANVAPAQDTGEVTDEPR